MFFLFVAALHLLPNKNSRKRGAGPPDRRLFRCHLVGVGLVCKFFPFLFSSSFISVVCPFTYRSAYLFTPYFWVVFVSDLWTQLHERRRGVILRKAVLTVVNMWNEKLLYFILILRCCLKKLFYFSLVSCFSKLSVFPYLPLLPCLGCGCLMPFMSLRLLKAGNFGGLPSLSLLVFPHFMSVNHLFGHFLGSFLQFTSHAK